MCEICEEFSEGFGAGDGLGDGEERQHGNMYHIHHLPMNIYSIHRRFFCVFPYRVPAGMASFGKFHTNQDVPLKRTPLP